MSTAIQKINSKEPNIREHTGEEAYAELRSKILKLAGRIEKDRWALAEYLYYVFDNGIYQKWGFQNWEQYVRIEVGLTDRSVRSLKYFFHIFEHEMKISEEKKERLKKVGWTKATALARLKKAEILNNDNLDHWINKASDTTVSKFKEEIRQEITKTNDKGSEEKEVFKKKIFMLAPDQSEIVENAIQMASAMLESTKRGHCISMVCQDFVATNMFQKRKDRSLMGQYLNKIGAILDAKIIAVDKETGKVIHNAKMLEKLRKIPKDKD